MDHNFEWVAKKNGNDLVQINRKAPLIAWGFGWSEANMLVKQENSLETVFNQRFWIICLQRRDILWIYTNDNGRLELSWAIFRKTFESS